MYTILCLVFVRGISGNHVDLKLFVIKLEYSLHLE